MRWKIIIVNAGIVAIVGLLSYVLLATALREIVANPSERKAEIERAVRAANARLELDGLRAERWMAEQVGTEEVREVFSGGIPEARMERATSMANRIREAAVKAPPFARMPPALVLFVDGQGVAIGRNGSNLMRGDKMAEVYPSLAAALETGHTGSGVWLNRQREEQMLASYAPVRGDDGAVVGALVIGTPLNDERVTATMQLTSGQSLVVGVKAETEVEIVAHSDGMKPAAVSAAASQAVAHVVTAALGSGNLGVVGGGGEPFIIAVAPLAGYGSDGGAALMAVAPSSMVGSIMEVLWPVLAVAGLGILLVVVGGFVLGNYISQPISEMEDGLLQIINGRTDLRFQLEHPDLGGLIFRINSLLNALMGVPETDEEGRTSVSPDQPYQE